jgi:recombination protein U
MTIHYPNGNPCTFKEKSAKKQLHIKVAPGNRGMGFEEDINQSNLYYKEKHLCLVTKRPTPINVVKVDYSHGAKITQAFFKSQSTTDYNGVYKGRYIDFEAKSTRSKTSFPLSNIAPQQVEHLRGVIENGGIAFFLINCYAIGETYLLEASYICDFYEQKPRKSIPLCEIKEKGHKVKEGYSPRYDYLPLIEEIFFK